MLKALLRTIFISKRGQRKYRDKYEKIFRDIYLTREIAKAEFIRVRFLSIISGASFIFFSLGYIFFRKQWIALTPYKIDVGYTPAFAAITFLYYSLLLSLIKLYKWDEKEEPLPIRIFTTCFEATIPSIFLFLLAIPTELSYITSAPQVLLYAPFMILCALRLNFRFCLLMGFIASTSYLTVAYYFLIESLRIAGGPSLLVYDFPHVHILYKALFIFLTALCAAYISRQLNSRIFDSFAHLQERDTMEKLLETHVSSNVANELIHNQNIDTGEEYDVSILFLDIRNFTSYTEKHSPKETFLFLNSFLLDMFTVIHENRGLVNKFLGDGFMAVFGAPIVDKNHAEQAVCSALSIRKIMVEKNKNRRRNPLKIGIGIHSGVVLGGNIGSDTRKEYALIGDTVNIASRIEQLNKKFHSDILVSKSTIEKCASTFPYKSVGEHLMKGKSETIEVLKLIKNK